MDLWVDYCLLKLEWVGNFQSTKNDNSKLRTNQPLSPLSPHIALSLDSFTSTFISNFIKPNFTSLLYVRHIDDKTQPSLCCLLPACTVFCQTSKFSFISDVLKYYSLQPWPSTTAVCLFVWSETISADQAGSDHARHIRQDRTDGGGRYVSVHFNYSLLNQQYTVFLFLSHVILSFKIDGKRKVVSCQTEVYLCHH